MGEQHLGLVFVCLHTPPGKEAYASHYFFGIRLLTRRPMHAIDVVFHSSFLVVDRSIVGPQGQAALPFAKWHVSHCPRRFPVFFSAFRANAHRNHHLN